MKTEKERKIKRKKLQKKFLFMRYTESWNATNKSSLFEAKFFEFEEFSIDTFFLGSIQPQHAVCSAKSSHWPDWYVLTGPEVRSSITAYSLMIAYSDILSK